MSLHDGDSDSDTSVDGKDNVKNYPHSLDTSPPSISLNQAVFLAFLSCLLTVTLLQPFTSFFLGHSLLDQNEFLYNMQTAMLNHTCISSYSTRIIYRDPTIMLIENFLQPGEAEHFIHLSETRLKPSTIGLKNGSESAMRDASRSSASAFFKKYENPIITCVEQRAANFTGIPMEDAEPLQVVRYYPGEEYKPHYDYFRREILHQTPSRGTKQRYATFLVYLNEEGIEGGETLFVKLGVKVRPRKGNALFWFNVGEDEMEDNRTLHAGTPVTAGVKYAVNIWQWKALPSLMPQLNDEKVEKSEEPK